MDEVTQHNAALVEEAAAAAQSMHAQSSGLKEGISVFRIATGRAAVPDESRRVATPAPRTHGKRQGCPCTRAERRACACVDSGASLYTSQSSDWRKF